MIQVIRWLNLNKTNLDWEILASFAVLLLDFLDGIIIISDPDNVVHGKFVYFPNVVGI